MQVILKGVKGIYDWLKGNSHRNIVLKLDFKSFITGSMAPSVRELSKGAVGWVRIAHWHARQKLPRFVFLLSLKQTQLNMQSYILTHWQSLFSCSVFHYISVVHWFWVHWPKANIVIIFMVTMVMNFNTDYDCTLGSTLNEPQLTHLLNGNSDTTIVGT